MQFIFANMPNYEDLGSGQVLYSAPGFPSFPARLSIEFFERAREVAGVERASFWDPMCGAGGIATTVGIACGDAISRILVSDVSGAALELAKRNLSLIAADGVLRRIVDLKHGGADDSRISSAERLVEVVRGRDIKVRTALADATNPGSLQAIPPGSVDIVVTDVPYGQRTYWQGKSVRPLAAMITALRQVMPQHGVVVIAARGREEFDGTPAAYRSFKHGHRLIKMYRCRDIA
jgi:tRNA G10  N-methylase Trm11